MNQILSFEKWKVMEGDSIFWVFEDGLNLGGKATLGGAVSSITERLIQGHKDLATREDAIWNFWEVVGEYFESA